MVNAAYLTTALCVLAVGARYLLVGKHVEEARTMLRMAVGLIAILAPLQLFIGDQHGLNTLEYQPIKVAAMEAHWDGSKPADFHILAWPDEKEGRNRFALSIPRGASLVLTHDPNGLVPGLNEVPPQDRPPVWSVFYAFRIMLAAGFAMIGFGLGGAWLWWRGRLFATRWYLLLAARSWWMGFVAIISGWVVTESGRQPWIVYGIQRTVDAVSPVPAATVASTLALFVLVYGVVFSAGIYFINRLIHLGLAARAEEEPREGAANRPIAAAQETGREAIAESGP
jgi:cytochrome d ubiquinol oxidase subunit I